MITEINDKTLKSLQGLFDGLNTDSDNTFVLERLPSNGFGPVLMVYAKHMPSDTETYLFRIMFGPFAAICFNDENGDEHYIASGTNPVELGRNISKVLTDVCHSL